MSKGILDSHEIPIQCDCGKETPKSIGWIKRNNQLRCSCGTLIDIDADQLIREINKVDRSFKDLQKSFDRLGKGR